MGGRASFHRFRSKATLVRGWQGFGLHDRHRLAVAASHSPLASLGTEHLGAAFLTLEPLAELIGHGRLPPVLYFLICMGWLQHCMAPLPPLVTMNSEPHLVHWYRLPVSFATARLTPLRIRRDARRIIGSPPQARQPPGRHPRPRPLLRPRSHALRSAQVAHAGSLRQARFPCSTSSAWYSLKSAASCGRLSMQSACQPP